MRAIVDCNSFYCSCERVFRPELQKKPIVVLSNNDGCIISISDEAKKLGVGMTLPYFKAKHTIEKNNIAVFSSNYNLYGDMSWRVMETLRTLLDDSNHTKVEVYSVDEAFLDLQHIPPKSLHEYARYVKETVEQWTGISVSIGVAPTKTLSKLANRMAKKNKNETGCISVLASREDQAAALKKTRISSVWGVGMAYAEKLINLGITSAWELSNMREGWALKNMGGVAGVRLIRELNGIPSIDMVEPLENKKMIATTRMFGNPVTELNDIKEAIATYTSRAAEKLRRQHSAAKTISVFIVPQEESHTVNFSHYPVISAHTILPAATSLTHELIKPALELTEQIYKKGKLYKKAGVMLSGLVPDRSIQANLFVSETKNSSRKLMDMVDNVNFSRRDDVLKFAASGTTRDWKMRQELRSKRYTTRWDELMEVK
jgi:DNA polymerase V